MERLVNKGGDSIEGVCSFIYRGYEISCSNTSKYGPEWDIVVFNPRIRPSLPGYIACDLEGKTVEDAIDWVNKQTSTPDVLTQLEKAVAIIGAILDRFSAEPPEACKKDFVEMVETIKKARGEETVTS